MNLLEQISKLVERSKSLSTIQWLRLVSSTGNHPHKSIAELNIALAVAETEEQRWNLFLTTIPLWTTQRLTEEAHCIFGEESVWKYNEPLVLSPILQDPGAERLHISIHCGQSSVCQIAGTRELLEKYHQEITASGHTITLAELNRRQGF